jgi:hypothetical protein
MTTSASVSGWTHPREDPLCPPGPVASEVPVVSVDGVFVAVVCPDRLKQMVLPVGEAHGHPPRSGEQIDQAGPDLGEQVPGNAYAIYLLFRNGVTEPLAHISGSKLQGSPGPRMGHGVGACHGASKRTQTRAKRNWSGRGVKGFFRPIGRFDGQDQQGLGRLSC